MRATLRYLAYCLTLGAGIGIGAALIVKLALRLAGAL